MQSQAYITQTPDLTTTGFSRQVSRCGPGSGHIGQGRVVQGTHSRMDASYKGRIVQGVEHARPFVRGHIDWGQTVMASHYCLQMCIERGIFELKSSYNFC